MPRLSLGLGVSSNSKLLSVPTVPSGIPVASTASLNISENATFNGIAFKKVSGERVLGIQGFSGELYVYSGIAYAYGFSYGQGKILIPPQTVIIDSYEFGYPDKLYTPSNTWRLVAAGYDGENDSYNIDSIANNPSTNPNYIPTTGWSPSLTIAADTFPLSITVAGTFGPSNLASNTLYPITNLNQIPECEIASLADQSIPYRIYLSTAINNQEYQTVDYKYVIYMDPSNSNGTSGYYNESISSGRWLFGCGYNFAGDNSSWYINFGYYTALQSKTTLPSSNVANWTRIAGYYPNTGNLTGITFNY
jgi:hypothetical protein